MPKVTVEGYGDYDVPASQKLVLALEDSGVHVAHRCGGNARCTTCRVEVLAGDVPPISEAEVEALEEPDLIEKYRLSCQIRVNADLTIRVPQTYEQQGYTEPGDRPED